MAGHNSFLELVDMEFLNNEFLAPTKVQVIGLLRNDPALACRMSYFFLRQLKHGFITETIHPEKVLAEVYHFEGHGVAEAKYEIQFKTLAGHDEGDEVIYEKIVKEWSPQFPFLLDESSVQMV